MVVDGRTIAGEILAKARERMEALGRVPRVRAVTVSPTPATESYLRIKSARAKDAGMELEVVRLPETATTDEVVASIEAPGADSVIIQLPLPGHIDAKKACDAIPVEKDADVLSARASDEFEKGAEGACIPPVADAVKEILERAGVSLPGKRAAVIGKGMLVGKPVALLLSRLGAATDSFEKGDEYRGKLAGYDIVVSGAGVPGLITPDLLKKGVVLIDAGTSESGGAIVGDADPSCASVASVFTPVPGGVGPVAVACLFRNASLLIKG